MAGEQLKEWLSRKEVSRLLETVGCPTSVGLLANMAANSNRGGGPPFYRSGWRIIRYKRDDVIKWAEQRMKRVD